MKARTATASKALSVWKAVSEGLVCLFQYAKTWLQTAKYMLKQVSDHRVLIGERSFSLPYVITTGDFEHYKLLAKDDATVLQV